MKALILAAALLAPGIANAAYGIEAQKQALSCTWTTIQQAFSGDFRHWALPGVVPSEHMRAGQYVDERCVVRGAPFGPQF